MGTTTSCRSASSCSSAAFREARSSSRSFCERPAFLLNKRIGFRCDHPRTKSRQLIGHRRHLRLYNMKLTLMIALLFVSSHTHQTTLLFPDCRLFSAASSLDRDVWTSALASLYSLVDRRYSSLIERSSSADICLWAFVSLAHC